MRGGSQVGQQEFLELFRYWHSLPQNPVKHFLPVIAFTSHFFPFLAASSLPLGVASL
jgi:hypothetical protein